MLRVFSPTGFNVYVPRINVLNHGFYGVMDFTDVVGANGIRPFMIQMHFPIHGTRAFFLRVTGVFAS